MSRRIGTYVLAVITLSLLVTCWISNEWFIWCSSQWLDWNNNQYNTIKSIQYYTRPTLIIISQTIGDKWILKFISSGWDVFKSLGVVQTVCHWGVSFFRQQIVQTGRFALPMSLLKQVLLKVMQCVNIKKLSFNVIRPMLLAGVAQWLLGWFDSGVITSSGWHVKAFIGYCNLLEDVLSIPCSTVTVIWFLPVNVKRVLCCFQWKTHSTRTSANCSSSCWGILYCFNNFW